MSHEEDGFGVSDDVQSGETTERSGGLDLRQPGEVERLVASGMQVSFMEYRFGSAANGGPIEDRVVCLIGPTGALIGHEGEGVYAFYYPDGTRIGPGQQQWGLTPAEAQAISTRANPSEEPKLN